MNDKQIADEITRVVNAANKECVVYLSPREKMPDKDFSLPPDAEVRFWVTAGEPSLDLEVHDTLGQRHIFIRKIGPQEPLDRLPIATWEGAYRLPDRIFPEHDKFRNDYEFQECAKGYSLYTEICEGLKPRSIFEIGVRYGYSAWAMLQGCWPGAVYHGIDVNSVEQASMMLHAEFPHHELRLARCDSGMLTSLSRNYDLAHVDGNHSHEGAMHDLGLCWGRAKYILVDDVDAFCTVNSAVNEFLSLHPKVPAVRFMTQTGHVMLGPLPLL